MRGLPSPLAVARKTPASFLRELSKIAGVAKVAAVTVPAAALVARTSSLILTILPSSPLGVAVAAETQTWVAAVLADIVTSPQLATSATAEVPRKAPLRKRRVGVSNSPGSFFAFMPSEFPRMAISGN
jgi:hypothetical protein